MLSEGRSGERPCHHVCKEASGRMDEQVLALAGAVIGLAIAITATILSVRTSRVASDVVKLNDLRIADRDQALRKLVADLHALMANEPNRPDADRIRARIEAMQIMLGEADLSAMGDLKVQAKVKKAGAHSRTVEVQRKDGSRATLGVDPSDAASVRAFLDDARRVRAERVVSVH